jgi:hypothetical protein
LGSPPTAPAKDRQQAEKILFDIVREDVEWSSDFGSSGSLTIDVPQRRAYADVGWYVLRPGPTHELTIEPVHACETSARKRRRQSSG